MLNLSLGYLAQADREREVTEDLRNRQSLLLAQDARTVPPTSSRQPITVRRSPVRVRNNGA